MRLFCQDSEQRTFIYIKGCVPQFEKWLQDNLTVVAGIFIGIALLQVGKCEQFVLTSDPFPRFIYPDIDVLFLVLDLWHLFSAESRERH